MSSDVTRRITRRRLLGAGVATAAVPILVRCGAAAPAASPSSAAVATATVRASVGPLSPSVKVTLGVVGSASDAGFYIAQERGYFKEEGLDVEFVPFQSGPVMVPPLGTGQLDVGGGGPGAGLFNAVLQDVPLRIVADKGSHRPGFIANRVVIRKDLVDSGQVKGYTGLKGQKVAVASLGNAGHVLLDKALRRGGITWKDVEVSALSSPDIAAAFTNKGIAASVAVEPFATQWEAQGLVSIPTDARDTYPDFQAAVVMYGPKFAQDKPEAAKRFMVAYVRALRDYNDAFVKNRDKEAIISILIKTTSLKDRALYDKVQLGGLDPNGYVLLNDLVAQQDWYFQYGYQKQKADMTKVVDNQFVQYAIDRLGTYKP
jgi:NitT/TauT family transport system substrate-binding protein